MRRLNINFGRSPRYRLRLNFLSMCLLTFLFVVSFIYYKHALNAAALALAQKQSDSASSARRVYPSMTDSKKTEALASQRQTAQLIIERLSIPWVTLLDALEHASSENVALLRVDPDATRREIRITMETDRISRAVSYAHALETTGVLTGLFVASQREETAGTMWPLQVVIAGTWTAGRNPLSPSELPLGSARTADVPEVIAKW